MRQFLDLGAQLPFDPKRLPQFDFLSNESRLQQFQAVRSKPRDEFLPRGAVRIIRFESAEGIDRLECTAAMTQFPIGAVLAIVPDEICLPSSDFFGIDRLIQLEKRVISKIAVRQVTRGIVATAESGHAVGVDADEIPSATAVERALSDRRESEDCVKHLVDRLNDLWQLDIQRALDQALHHFDISLVQLGGVRSLGCATAGDHRMYLRLKIVLSNEVEKAIDIDCRIEHHQRADVHSFRAEPIDVVHDQCGGRTIVLRSAIEIMQRRISVERNADVNVVRFEEFDPTVVDQRAVRLHQKLQAAIRQMPARVIDQSSERVSAVEQRLKVDKAFVEEISSIERSFRLKKK